MLLLLWQAVFQVIAAVVDFLIGKRRWLAGSIIHLFLILFYSPLDHIIKFIINYDS